MQCQERRGTDSDGNLSDSGYSEEQRRESGKQPVSRRQIGRPPATTTQNNQLVFEQEILRDHRAYTTGATEPRGHDGQVQRREQQIPTRAAREGPP